MIRTFHDGRAVMHHGDSRDVLRTLADASIDSVVCDPPYALVSIVKRFGADGAAPANPASGAYARASAGFMGQSWDTGETAFAVEFWTEVLRVLKPGGHVIAFSGTRTYHRLAVAIEDAGFEIRDQLAWVYGTGFPKSHDVSKAIDKAAGAKREVVGRAPDWKVSAKFREMEGRADRPTSILDITIPATPEAAQWAGWGTALKPAWEPIVLARKPLAEGTVAANVLTPVTGAIKVDACRVGDEVTTTVRNGNSGGNGAFGRDERAFSRENPPGRFPANLVHDGSPEALAGFPCSASTPPGNIKPSATTANTYGKFATRSLVGHTDSGSAARFFYCAKASKRDRAGSKHPTVKPVDLMRWLVRLVTKPGGTVLEPFAGSGTTLQACLEEGVRVIGVEREPAFFEDCCTRLDGIDGEPKPRREHAVVVEDATDVEPSTAPKPKRERKPVFVYPSFLDAAE